MSIAALCKVKNQVRVCLMSPRKEFRISTTKASVSIVSFVNKPHCCLRAEVASCRKYLCNKHQNLYVFFAHPLEKK